MSSLANIRAAKANIGNDACWTLPGEVEWPQGVESTIPRRTHAGPAENITAETTEEAPGHPVGDIEDMSQGEEDSQHPAPDVDELRALGGLSSRRLVSVGSV